MCALQRLHRSMIHEEEISQNCFCHDSFEFSLILLSVLIQTEGRVTLVHLSISQMISLNNYSKCHLIKRSPGAYVSSHCSLYQMSQNNYYDSQGQREKSSAVQMSVQMNPSVTPGASRPSYERTVSSILFVC